MSLSKGMNENWNLELLLNAFPWLGGRRNPEISYVSVLLGAAELVRKGCTAAYDLFSEFPAPTSEGVEAVARAYNDIGMRAVIAPMMADRSFYQSIPGLLEAMPPPVREEADSIRFALPSGVRRALPDHSAELGVRSIIDKDRHSRRPFLIIAQMNS